MTRNWTRREWTVLVKACAALFLLATFLAPITALTPAP